MSVHQSMTCTCAGNAGSRKTRNSVNGNHNSQHEFNETILSKLGKSYSYLNGSLDLEYQGHSFQSSAASVILQIKKQSKFKK